MAALTKVKQRILSANDLPRIQNGIGVNAKPFTSATDKDETNTFHGIFVVEDGTAFTNLSMVLDVSCNVDRQMTLSSLDTFLSGTTLNQGTFIPGVFANIKLSAGKIIAYSLEKIS